MVIYRDNIRGFFWNYLEKGWYYGNISIIGKDIV